MSIAMKVEVCMLLYIKLKFINSQETHAHDNHAIETRHCASKGLTSVFMTL